MKRTNILIMNPLTMNPFGRIAASKIEWLMQFVLASVVGCFMLSANPTNAAEKQKAGEATLVIGEASAQAPNGERRVLQRGDAVYVEDTIETEAGGHVHLRFIDDGTISVRPNSRLNIEFYRYDPAHPENNAIRFNLESGVLRSISGKATEAAHDRFRLNTPITAIGVLGTDFVVRAENQKMWAGVYSGAIAVAPFNEKCLSSGLGPCKGATKLSESMGSMMLELRDGKIIERMLTHDPELMSKTGANVQDVSENADQSNTSSALVSGRMTVDELKVAEAATRLQEIGQNTVEPSPIEPSPTKPLPIPSSPFAWARWGAQWPMDSLSQSFGEASEGREVTVGNRYFALYRAPSSLTELEPRAGVYDFKLTQGQVHFVGNGVSWAPTPQPAQLDAAKLQIDFGQRQFHTHLQMSHERAGSSTLNLSGAIRNDGVFTARGGNGRAAGALSLDGEHAGMLFESQVKSGTFHGITDWIKGR